MSTAGFFFVQNSAILQSIINIFLDDGNLGSVLATPSIDSTKYYWAKKKYIPNNGTAAASETDLSGNPNLFNNYTTWEINDVVNPTTGALQGSGINEFTLTNGYIHSDISGEPLSFLGNAFQSGYVVFLVAGVPPTPEAAPCFLAGAIVETDQGPLPIETINPAVNTIGGNRIVAITESNPRSTKMVRLVKNVISANIPNKDTDITHTHNVLYEGTFRPACKVPGLKYRPYKGETLYNVLMETHQTMVVNNMRAKTLPPDHPAALKFRK